MGIETTTIWALRLRLDRQPNSDLPLIGLLTNKIRIFSKHSQCYYAITQTFHFSILNCNYVGLFYSAPVALEICLIEGDQCLIVSLLIPNMGWSEIPQGSTLSLCVTHKTLCLSFFFLPFSLSLARLLSLTHKHIHIYTHERLRSS